MRAWRRPRLAALIAVITTSASAGAQPTDEDRALATTRFNEGKALMAEQRYAEACPKLEESERLDPFPGTLLNLAVCHENQGRSATAVAEYRAARALAERDHRGDRVAFADDHLRLLEPKVPALVIVVGPEADVPGLKVTRDSSPVDRGAWGQRIAVDPGEHVVQASAPDKKPSTITVAVNGDGAIQIVTLAPLAAEVPPAPTPSPPLARPVATQLPIAEGPIERTSESPRSSARVGGIVLGGVGLAAVAAGSYFGVRAIQKHDDPAAICTTIPCPESVSLNDQAKFAADASTVSFALGIAALAAGTGLWLWAGQARHHASSLPLVPSFGAGGGSLRVVGTF